jgi:hypothetical protein
VFDAARSLEVADHTALVQAVIDRPLHVLRYLNLVEGVPPTPAEVLEAASKVTSFDSKTRTRIKLVRDVYPILEAGSAQLPQPSLRAVERLQAALIGKPIEQKIVVIAQMRQECDSDGGLAAALGYAEEILLDGAETIYAPENPIYELLDGSEFSTIGDLAATDAVGAAGGGLAGFLLSGGTIPGAMIGALAGGGGASAGFVIGTIAAMVLM